MGLRGRLGLESARVPHSDRHGVLWLARGRLYVDSGTVRFATTGTSDLAPGDYGIPFQMLHAVVLEPGTTVTHDALRILSAHGTGLVAAGEDGVRFYASMPAGTKRSERARRHARIWADEHVRRIDTARRMYAWRFGGILPQRDLNALRGIEGSRMRASYKSLAQRHGIDWSGRRYDRRNPGAADPPNQAINHAASAMVGAAEVAVAIAGAIPSLGFIHEGSAIAFPLDIADLYRTTVTVPAAFTAVNRWLKDDRSSLEREVRKTVGRKLRTDRVVTGMIDRIKELLDADDDRGHAKRP